MLPFEARQRFTAQATLGAGDATKTLFDVGTTQTAYITSVIATCLVSAAQAVYVGDSSGTVEALSLAASFTLHGQASVQLLNGLALTKGEDVIAKPAAAGPSFHVVVEGYLE